MEFWDFFGDARKKCEQAGRQKNIHSDGGASQKPSIGKRMPIRVTDRGALEILSAPAEGRG
jgi:hypothetical protein